MNINFHYFTIKTIAKKAGLKEEQAQTLAAYSQLVDDYDIYASRVFDNVPEFARHLAEKRLLFSGWNFYPVTTGFNSWGDMARLLLEVNQRQIVVPFHFITKKPLNRFEKTVLRDEYRTTPAKLDTPSLMRQLLFEARDTYKSDPSRKNLIRVGMLLHIFADTYAHQLFSGFWGWENHSKLTEVRDTLNGEILTKKYTGKESLPSIGHTNVYHAPDDSYVDFDMDMKLKKGEEYDLHYNRSNTREFVLAARQIYEYIVMTFDKTLITDDEWDEFRKRLVHGFWLTETDIPTLCRRWEGEFPEYSYYYDKNQFMASFTLVNSDDNKSNVDDSEFVKQVVYGNNPEYSDILLSANDEYFFWYNVIAKEIRDCVIGEVTPIKQLAEENSAIP